MIKVLGAAAQTFPLEEVNGCPACGHGSYEAVCRVRDDRYGYPATFLVGECSACGLAYLPHRVAKKHLANLYATYYSQEMKSDIPASSLQHIKSILKGTFIYRLYQGIIGDKTDLYAYISNQKKVTVLDIGSSSSVIHKMKRFMRFNNEWIGVEIDPHLCKLLNDAGLPNYCGSLEEFAAKNQKPFDHIIMSQILEHVYNPSQFLVTAYNLLKPGGSVLLSCPNYHSFMRQKYGEKWIHWHVPYHVAYYHPESLRLLAEQANLRISWIRTFTPFQWYYVQTKMAQGLPFNSRWHGKYRWLQRLMNLKWASHNRAGRGDALVAWLVRTT